MTLKGGEIRTYVVSVNLLNVANAMNFISKIKGFEIVDKSPWFSPKCAETPRFWDVIS